MFEQERYASGRRPRSVFQTEEAPGAGMSRYQVSGAGDPAEAAAEQAADSAVGGGSIFRAPEGADVAGFTADLSDADLGGIGTPLPDDLMGSMEQSLGASFAGVRLHTDAGADRASRQLSARAFTRGQDVYFRDGAYSPDTREGQHLIAHELAHVAAGDGGIHRAPDQHTTPTSTLRDSAGSSGVSKSTVLELALESSAKVSRDELAQVNAFIGECGTRESLAAEIGAGRIGKDGVQGRISRAQQMKATLDIGIADLEKNMSDYVAEVSGNSGNQDAAKQNQHYQEAQAALDSLKAAKEQLTTTVEPALQWAIDGLNARDSGSGGSEFPKTVERLLDNPACGQFFKAVEDVRKGAGGEDISSSEEAAFNSDAAKDLREENVGAGGLDKAGRFFSSAGAGLGIVGTGVSAVELGSSFDEEIKGEGNVNDHSERAGTAASHMSAIVDTLGAANDIAAGAVETRQLQLQEKARSAKIKAMQQSSGEAKNLRSADHSARVAAAGSWMGASSSILGFSNSIYGTTTGKGDDTKTAMEEKQGNILSVSSDTLAVGGDIMGLAADSRQADQMKKRDAATKQSMHALGAQLRKSLDETPNLVAEKQTLLNQICARMKESRFNKATPPLKELINNALQGPGSGSGQQAAPQAAGSGQQGTQTSGSGQTAAGEDLSPKQKRLLVTLLAMETSRATTKDAASSARWDVGFDVLGTIGDMTSLASSVSFMAGSGMVGLILSTISSAIGLIGSIRDAHNARKDNGASGQQGRNEERNNKVNACRAAVKQMAVLPPLDLGALRATRQAKLPLPADQRDAAEQYAAVFSIVDAADVNMVDFLYAIHEGGFGSETASGQQKSVDDSLKDMYAKLSFT